MTHALSRFLNEKHGAALVEFTLVAPLLVLLMCGMAEFACAMRQYHIMEKGVRDAGRYLARAEMSGCTIDADATTAAQNLALTGQISGGDNLLPTWIQSPICNTSDGSASVRRRRARMRATSSLGLNGFTT